MKKMRENDIGNIYLTTRRGDIYCDNMFLSQTEARIGLSNMFVSDCVRGISAMAGVMDKEISEKLLGETQGRKKRGFIIGQRYRRRNG